MRIGLGLGLFSIVSGPDAAAPTISAVDNTRGNAVGTTAGGFTVTITGTGFDTGGLTGVTFGGTSGTSLNVLDDTTATIVAPAKTAGQVDVIVTGPGGSNTLTNGFRYWDPAVEGTNYNAWFRETKTLSGSNVSEWTDKSGNARHLQQGTDADRPEWLATGGPNSQQAVSFDRSNTEFLAGSAVSNFISNTTFYSYALVNITDITEDDDIVTLPHTNECIWSDAGLNVGMYLKQTGSLVYCMNYDGTFDSSSKPLATSGWQLVTIRHVSGNISIRLGDGAFSSNVAAGNTFDLSAALRVGFTATVNEYLNGKISELIFRSTDPGSTVDEYYLDYVETHYNLDLSDPAIATISNSISTAIGDTAGGYTVTISGSLLTGTSAVTIGGVAATGISVVNDNSVTCTVPDLSTAGLKDVVVTTSSGTSTLTNGFRAWDPSELTLTGWWKAGSWTLSGSDITQLTDLSGNSRHFTAGSNFPQATTFNSRNAIDTNGTTQLGLSVGSATLLPTTGSTFIAVTVPDTVSPGGVPSILTDASNWLLYLPNGGGTSARASTRIWDSAYRTATSNTVLSNGNLYVVEYRHDGTDAFCRVNGNTGEQGSATCTTRGGSGASMTWGNLFDGKSIEAIAYSGDMSLTDRDRFYSYAWTRING